MSHGAKLFRVAVGAVVCVVGMAVWSGSQEGRPKTGSKDSPTGPPTGGSKEPAETRGGDPSPASAKRTGDEAVFEKLLEPTEFSFKETPLEEAVAAISKKHKLPVAIDHTAIDEAHCSTKTPLTRTARDVPLETALKQLLNDVGLAYIVRDEAIEVTSQDGADTYLIYRIYPVADLVVPPQHGAAANADATPDYESLIALMARLVRPESWADSGGPGIAEELPGCLIVQQTIDNHRQIQRLLQVLRKARKAAEESGVPKEAAIRVFESPIEQRIDETLGRRVSVALADASLDTVAKTLAKENGIPIEINHKKVEETNVDVSRARFRLAAEGLSLRSALKWLLRKHELSWIVRDDRLMITSRDEAQAYLVTRLYPVADMVPDGGRDAFLERRAVGPFGPPAAAPAPDNWLVRTIKDSVWPDRWRDAGGPGEIEWLPHVPVLVCSTDQEAHREVERLLADLRKHVVASPKPASGTSRPASRTILWAYPIAADSADRAKVADAAARLIQDTIAPETWNSKETGAFVRAWPDRLIVRHTAKVHREVQNLLDEVGVLKPPRTADPQKPPQDD